MKIILLLILALFTNRAGSDTGFTYYREAADSIQSTEEIYRQAVEFYNNGEYAKAKGYLCEVVSRTTRDSTLSELDFRTRIMLARNEEQIGNLSSAQKWLNSINIHANKSPWVHYPDNWRNTLITENRNLAVLKAKEERSQRNITTATIAAAVVFCITMIVFICLYAAKKKAYRILAEQAEKFSTARCKIYTGDTIQDGDIRLLTDKITDYVEESKCYLSHSLKLDDIVYALGSNRTYVSTAINSIAPNFNVFINEYRIKDAIRLIMADETLSFDQVATNCGFNSRKSFTNAFKEFTGLTPSDFKSNI